MNETLQLIHYDLLAIIGLMAIFVGGCFGYLIAHR